MFCMRQMTRTLLLISTIWLGWLNMPAQADIVSDNRNIWSVISQHFTIPSDIHKTGVQAQIDRDLQHPKYIRHLTENARPYLYTVFQETEKRHMPAELALLPMVESNYIPAGRSNMGAVGLWQLMPDTAYGYGVKMNSWYDGRRSTTVSTKVALTFLSYLYEQFDHNWLLALAAYNAGPGTVMAAIHYNEARGRPTDFWALPLPKQTQAYIPKLLALAAIIQHPAEYGIHLSPVMNKPVASAVTIKKQMPLEKIASLAHTSVSTVKKLNPALSQSSTPPHQTITVMLPVNKKPVFEQHMKAQKVIDDAIAAKKLDHYTVQHGDSLDKIAKKFHTTVSALQEINQLRSGLIRIHQALLVPKLFEEIDHHKTTAKPAVTKAVVKHITAHVQSHFYTVKRGDNLRVIARIHHTTIAHLMAINHLRHSMLSIGEHLKLP